MRESEPTVCVLGLGYIGLPTASLLATKGMQVLGVDINSHVVQNLNKGRITIQEPSLDVMVKSAVQSGNLKASLIPEAADVFIISVPTPCSDEHKPDVSYVKVASESLAPYLRPGNLVILESTSPVGTTEKVGAWIQDVRRDLRISIRGASIRGDIEPVYIAHCPERVLPGKILHELVHNDRTVGGVDSISTERAVTFYRRFVAGNILATDSRSAELSKLAENVFRDVNIALANELSLICDRLDIDVWKLIELANHHPRVNILQPGPGVGGHCIAVDPWFVVDAAPELAKLIRSAREVNDAKPHAVVEKILRAIGKLKKGAPNIACLGLSYKADVDDLRESPAIEIVNILALAHVGNLDVVEPNIDALPKRLNVHANVSFTPFDVAVHRADIVVLLVDHKVFREMDNKLLEDKLVIDTRGIWSR